MTLLHRYDDATTSAIKFLDIDKLMYFDREPSDLGLKKLFLLLFL